MPPGPWFMENGSVSEDFLRLMSSLDAKANFASSLKVQEDEEKDFA